MIKLPTYKTEIYEEKYDSGSVFYMPKIIKTTFLLGIIPLKYSYKVIDAQTVIIPKRPPIYRLKDCYRGVEFDTLAEAIKAANKAISYRIEQDKEDLLVSNKRVY